MEKSNELKNYQNICKALDKNDLKYDKDPDGLTVNFGISDTDIAIQMTIYARSDSIQFVGRLDLEVTPAQRISTIQKLNKMNAELKWGRFYTVTRDDGDKPDVDIVAFEFGLFSEDDDSFSVKAIKKSLRMSISTLVSAKNKLAGTAKS